MNAITPKSTDIAPISNDIAVANTNNIPVIQGASNDSLRRYLNEIKKFPMLTAEEEFAYIKAYKEDGDREAVQKVITSHLRLVARIAMGYRGYGLPMADIIAEGNVGMMQAVKKFDHERGFRFATYAMWWIKASINEYVLQSWSMVKIGTTAAQKKLFFNLRRIKAQLNLLDNTEIQGKDLQYIAESLDVSEQDVLMMNSRLSNAEQSLDAPIAYDDGNSTTLQDYLVDDADSPEDIVIERDSLSYQRQQLHIAMENLSEREQHIIHERHLIGTPRTLESLSEEYKVSRERIRQIEARALEKIQTFIGQANHLALPSSS